MSIHPLKASVTREGPDPVAWRVWPVSPQDVPGPLYDDVVAFNLHRQIYVVGYGDWPMRREPDVLREFALGKGWNKNHRSIAFQFTHQMRRGDIVLICKNTAHVFAWALLLDDVPMFFEEDDRIWKELGPLRDRVHDAGAGELFCNYRRVDQWRRIDAAPQTEDGKLPGSVQPTVKPFTEDDVVDWLGLNRDEIQAARDSLPPEVDDPDTYTIWPAPTKSTPAKPKNGQGRALDIGRRDAVELHAMAVATRHYESQGYEVEDTSAKHPYDLVCAKGDDERRVEVKGTTLSAATIQLTANEVKNASEFVTDLFVVSNIVCAGHGDRAEATGGEARLYEEWEPKEKRLKPTAYVYELDDDFERVEAPDTDGGAL